MDKMKYHKKLWALDAFREVLDAFREVLDALREVLEERSQHPQEQFSNL